MQPHTAIIITSISAPNQAMTLFAEGAKSRGMDFFVIGDVRSPAEFALEGSRFFSLAEQHKIGFTFVALCPERHYARKNIGYLLAIQAGAEIILDTDDDNLPYSSFWNAPKQRVQVHRVNDGGWINVYRYFSDVSIWPRGLSLRHLASMPPTIDELQVLECNCPIQQGLANENPDVDAIYRLALPLPLNFREDVRVALGKGSWCPFNSQNTRWFQEAFPLLYLPSYCSFRMTDIWRSFVAQRIAWENGWDILFHEPTVWQERNAHDLLKDFADEIPGYLHNDEIVALLGDLPLQAGVAQIPANLRRCYGMLAERKLVGKEELNLLDAWLADLSALHAMKAP